MAYSKHGNYTSIASCDAGGATADECRRDYVEQVEVHENRNIGAIGHPIDEPAVYARLTEYFTREPIWDGSSDNFCGWVLEGPGDSECNFDNCVPHTASYGRALRRYGFVGGGSGSTASNPSITSITEGSGSQTVIHGSGFGSTTGNVRSRYGSFEHSARVWISY